MSYTNYARLGYSCQTNMDTIVDNSKFFPIDDPVYKIFYTKMKQYPLANEINPVLSSEVERPEDIKTTKQKIKIPENFKTPACCGKK
jgi:hypothetical protein